MFLHLPKGEGRGKATFISKVSSVSILGISTKSLFSVVAGALQMTISLPARLRRPIQKLHLLQQLRLDLHLADARQQHLGLALFPR